MAAERSLPERRNPLVSPKHTPQLSTLVERRRLGQTELTVKPGQVNTSNATKLDNLGMFDYAHLRVPLPKDLQGSGIFTLQRNQHYPEAYFLMRRSSDGYISATGMYKAAFPWSSQEEEEIEKRYIKSLPETGPEEVAGNVWISPEAALELADEYDMRTWIEALLDSSPIPKGTHDPTKRIATPPRFVMPRPETDAISLPPPEPMSTRKRSLRSASPVKAPPTPSRMIATPRRTRRARGTVATSNLATSMESADESHALDASVEPESVNGDAFATSGLVQLSEVGRVPAPVFERVKQVKQDTTVADGSIKVDITTTTEDSLDGGEPLTTTHVTVETPANHPDLKVPTNPQAYLDQAKAAIAEANRLTAGRAAGKKRKAMEMFEDESDEEIVSVDEEGEEVVVIQQKPKPSMELIEQPAKRLRVTETELRKEKIKRRATMGIAASLVVGSLLPVVMGTFFNAL